MARDETPVPDKSGEARWLIDALRNVSGVDHFIETGTYLGDTAAWAVRRFGTVDTIELSPLHHSNAQQRFAGTPQVRLHLGSSETILAGLLKELDRPAIFWLDAHWSGPGTDGQKSECPLLTEIAAIDSTDVEHLILIDDARYFFSPPPIPHDSTHWPELPEVLAALQQKWDRSYIAVWKEIIIRAPHELRDETIRVLRQRWTAELS